MNITNINQEKRKLKIKVATDNIPYVEINKLINKNYIKPVKQFSNYQKND